jgi:hypothetical protein
MSRHVLAWRPLLKFVRAERVDLGSPSRRLEELLRYRQINPLG